MDNNSAPAVSGCKVEMVDGYVRKSCEKDYRLRLWSQAEKQRDYKLGMKQYNICVPSVVHIEHEHFDMEYFDGFGYTELVETASSFEVVDRLARILEFVEHSLTSSVLPSFQYGDFHFYSLVEEQLAHPNFPTSYKWVAGYLRDLPTNRLPQGSCHGDLTLSNVMFDNSGRVCLYDFNDTPVSSPIFDIIKLRQDALFHWTSRMSSTPHDRVKVELVDNWLAGEIESVLEFTNTNMPDYKFWEALNYFRIFRNVGEDEATCEWLVECIERVLG